MDGVFLTDTAEEILKRKEVLKVPVMMGITNHEFGWILPQVTQFSMPLFQIYDILSVASAAIPLLILCVRVTQSSLFSDRT